MAGSVVAASSVASQTTTLSCAMPTGTAQNDVMVAEVANDWDTYANITAPGGWTLLGGYDNGADSIHVKVFTKTAGAAEAGPYAFGQGSGGPPDGVAGIVTLRGVVEAGAQFQLTYTSTTGTTRTAPSVTGADSGAVLVAGAMTDGPGPGTWTPPSGMAEQVDVQSTNFTTQTMATLLDPGSPTGTKDFAISGAPPAPGGAQWSAVFLTGAGVTNPAQPAKVSDRGTVADATAATTSAVTLTSPTTIAVGNYLVARVAVDNSGTNGAAPGCTVTDPRSNTWTVLGPALADPGVAAAGATAYLCYARVGTAYQAADALTFNWGGVSTTAKAVVVEEWANIHRVTPVAVAAATNDSVAAASTTAVTVSRTATTPNQLVYAMLATEGIAADTVGADADTTNGSWVTLTTTASANATATNNMRVSGQYKIVSAAGAQSWDSTITSRDWAAIAVVFAVDDPPPPRVFVRPGLAATQGGSW